MSIKNKKVSEVINVPEKLQYIEKDPRKYFNRHFVKIRNSLDEVLTKRISDEILKSVEKSVNKKFKQSVLHVTKINSKGVEEIVVQQFINNYNWADCMDYEEEALYSALKSNNLTNVKFYEKLHEISIKEKEEEKERIKEFQIKLQKQKELLEKIENSEKEMIENLSNNMNNYKKQKLDTQIVDLSKTFLLSELKKYKNNNNEEIKAGRVFKRINNNIVNQFMDSINDGSLCGYITPTDPNVNVMAEIESFKKRFPSYIGMKSTEDHAKEKAEREYITNRMAQYFPRYNLTKEDRHYNINDKLPYYVDPDFKKIEVVYEGKTEEKIMNQITLNIRGVERYKLLFSLMLRGFLTNSFPEDCPDLHEIQAFLFYETLVGVYANKMASEYTFGIRISLLFSTTDTRILTSIKNQIQRNWIPALEAIEKLEPGDLSNLISNCIVPRSYYTTNNNSNGSSNYRSRGAFSGNNYRSDKEQRYGGRK